MTEKKPIIIDGCDVSSCIFHSLTAMGYVGYNYCKCFECVCEYHNDCCSKQLARKTQECEILQQSENEAKEIIAELTAENKQAEQKLEKIREYCNKYPQNSIGFKKNILQIIDGVE